jgi:hypothetical protein
MRSEKNKIKWKVDVGPDEQNQQNNIANIE